MGVLWWKVEEGNQGTNPDFLERGKGGGKEVEISKKVLGICFGNSKLIVFFGWSKYISQLGRSWKCLK